jgi:hypothetical protein
LRHSQKLAVSFGFERQTLKLLALVLRKRTNVVIEPGNIHPTLLVAKAANQLAQCHGWIVYCPAKNTGVQVASRPAQSNLKCSDSSEAAGKRRVLLIGHPRIGDYDRIAREFLAIVFQELEGWRCPLLPRLQ